MSSEQNRKTVCLHRSHISVNKTDNKQNIKYKTYSIGIRADNKTKEGRGEVLDRIGESSLTEKVTLSEDLKTVGELAM